MDQNDPFAVNAAHAEPVEDLFAPAPNVSEFPKAENLRGHLLLVRPTKLEEGLISALYSKPGKPHFYDRITADVVVLDGPVDGFADNEFNDMYFSQTRLVSQMKAALRDNRMILARLDTYQPGTEPGQGNPWGLVTEYTEAEAVVARQYLAAKAKRKASDPFGN